MISKNVTYLSLLLLLGCGIKEPTLGDLIACPTSENFVENSFPYNMNAGDKVANRFRLNGITTGKVNLSSVRLHMSTDHITSINVKIYQGDDSRNPDYGTLLNSTTVAVNSNNSDDTTAVDIPLSANVPLAVTIPTGENYFIVISPSPGAYDLSVTSSQKISASRIDTYTGSWNIGGSNGSGNISMIFNYNGCTY